MLSALKQFCSDSADGDTEVAVILNTVGRLGFRAVNENKKLAEFCSPSGKTIYVVKTRTNQNNIKVLVHPSLNVDTLHRLAGIDSVGNEYRFHSNMPQFPKRLHNGKTETTYGWQISIGTLGGLVMLPERAAWLQEFQVEVLQFPHGRHDDQVDSMSQFLGWISRRRLSRPNIRQL